MEGTEKYQRNKSLGSTGIQNAMAEQEADREDQLINQAKQNFEKVEDSNDNQQLNKYLYPPFTDDKRKNA